MVEGGVVGAPVYEVQVVEVLEGEHDLRSIEPGVRLAGGGVRGGAGHINRDKLALFMGKRGHVVKLVVWLGW